MRNESTPQGLSEVIGGTFRGVGRALILAGTLSTGIFIGESREASMQETARDAVVITKDKSPVPSNVIIVPTNDLQKLDAGRYKEMKSFGTLGILLTASGSGMLIYNKYREEKLRELGLAETRERQSGL